MAAVDAGADVVVDDSNAVAPANGDRNAAADDDDDDDDDAAAAAADDDDTVDDKGSADIRNDDIPNDGVGPDCCKDVTTFVFEDGPTLISWKVL